MSCPNMRHTPVEATQYVDGRGLARAVLAEEAEYAPLRHTEAEVLVDESLAVVVGQVLALYHDVYGRDVRK